MSRETTIATLLADVDAAWFVPPRDPALLPEARRGGWALPHGLLDWARTLALEPDVVLPYTAFLRFFEDGNRQEYEEHYFRRRRRLEVFALAVLSGQGDRFLAPLQNVLAALCEESTWALPAHLAAPDAATIDLFAAETASALAEIRCLLEETLDASLVTRIDEQIERRVLGPYLAERTAWPWETAPHNWAAVCGGAVGITALWLADQERLGRVLSTLGPTLDAYLSGFPDDGLCLEGMGYWTYGLGYFVAFAELLKDRSRGKVDLLGHPDLMPRLRTLASFPAAGRLGDRGFARFSDSLDVFRYPPGLVSRLVERLGVPQGLSPELAEDLAFDPCCRWVRHLRDSLWTEASELRTTERGHSVNWYASSQWLVARGWVHGQAVGLAAKGGHNDEPHNHNDVGTLELVVGDHSLLEDLGAGRYERDYFREGRYDYFVNSSRSHCVPLIEGQAQSAGRERRATGVHYGPGALSMDLAAAYDVPGLVSVVRTLQWTPETVLPLRLTDRFEGAADRELAVVERFVTRFPVRIEAHGVSIDGPAGSLRVEAEGRVDSITVNPVVYAPHRGADRTAFCIDFACRMDPGASLPFRLEFVPLGE